MSEEEPQGWRRPWRFVQTIVKGLFVHHAFDHAATMAFYFFLGMIPLILCAGLLAGTLARSEGAEELMAPLYRTMPTVAAELIRKELYEVTNVRAGTVAPLSVLGFVWLTTNGVHNLMDVFELLLHARQRSWWRQRLIAIAWLAATVFIVALAAWALFLVNGTLSGVDSARDVPVVVRRTRDFFVSGWHRIGALAVFAALSSSGLAVFYRLAVVHPRGVRRRVWPGTFVAHALWLLVSWAFGSYVRSAQYAVFYGSLATVAIILLWLYLTSLALIVGAEVNAQLEGVRNREDKPAL